MVLWLKLYLIFLFFEFFALSLGLTFLKVGLFENEILEEIFEIKKHLLHFPYTTIIVMVITH